MENSDSDDEDESTAMVQNQMDRLVREEDFYRFVNNLNDEDYKLMRDNDLLGNPGESTEEELLRRLQQLKENPLQNVHENTGGGDTSDDESSAQSLLNWLLSSEETDESVTSEHTEHQSCRELSQVSPNNDFTFNSETYFHLNNDNSNLENEYEPPTRLPRGENIENRQSHVENLCSESTFTRPSRSEQSITEALSEVPLTRGQRRARSRSPDHRRTRARSENCWSPVCSMSEVFQRFHQDASSPTSEQPVVNATERLTRTQLQETLRQQITGHDLQNRDLFATPRTRNRESPVQRESSQDTTRGDVSHRLRQISPTIFLDSELARVHPGAYSESESIASRTQITSETSINTFTLESEQGGPRPMFSYSEQADMRAHVSTISIPIHTTLNTGLNDTTSVATQSNPWQAMTDFSDLSNLMNNDNDLEPCVSPSSQNVEKRESPTGRESCDSRSSGANSDSDHDSHSPSALISSSNSSYRSPFNSSPTSDSSSSDEDPYGNSLMFETPDERSLSPVSFSQTRQHSRSMSPVSFDDSDSWTSLDLDQFFLVSDDQNHSTGLTREQIDNLTVRSFGKNEVLKSCSICIMEYTEGNRLRVLPCSHEYHIHCIDRWLADNSTCPVCRGKVVDSGEGENSN
ncbi:E3 ubiquitin-protein ligase RLIM-like [Rhinolophus ferrumequinum]|uniref:E3 ubiquitin-protein ligase RLIM-like n=1 Tax=Rhinolophus ferrumequinum TaxID=59479 RepID=UPI00140FD04E|nr:E3 ubiquitin-protein ligase RLIM-like [Rhinolophus ferrumequinum]